MLNKISCSVLTCLLMSVSLASSADQTAADWVRVAVITHNISGNATVFNDLAGGAGGYPFASSDSKAGSSNGGKGDVTFMRKWTAGPGSGNIVSYNETCEVDANNRGNGNQHSHALTVGSDGTATSVNNNSSLPLAKSSQTVKPWSAPCDQYHNYYENIKVEADTYSDAWAQAWITSQ